MFDCQNLSFLAIGAAMLMLASSANVPKLMSRRDLRSVGTLILAAGVVMLLAKMCSPKKIAAAKYSLSPAPVSSEDDGAYSMDRELSSALLDTAKLSLECWETMIPISTSHGMCRAVLKTFVKEQNCMEGSIGSA